MDLFKLGRTNQLSECVTDRVSISRQSILLLPRYSFVNDHSIGQRCSDDRRLCHGNDPFPTAKEQLLGPLQILIIFCPSHRSPFQSVQGTIRRSRHLSCASTSFHALILRIQSTILQHYSQIVDFHQNSQLPTQKQPQEFYL